MLAETFVSTILTASVAGAGLVLAVYTLIASLLDKIIKTRRELITEKTRKFNDLLMSYETSNTDANLRQLTESHNQLRTLRSFPKYLSYGMFFSFLFYFFASFFALSWFIIEEPSYEILQILFFGLASLVFLSVGIYTIVEVFMAMKHEWRILEKEREEVEKTTSEKLSQLEKDVEYLKRRGILQP